MGEETDIAGRIVAHRGASRIAPENTMSAFRRASELGAGWIEFDVSLLGDGTPVVHHDATWERCTTGTGALAETDRAALEGLDAGSWFSPAFVGEPVPLLSDVLAALVPLGLRANLEMKPHDGDPARIADIVAGMLRPPEIADRVLVSSFSEAALEALRAAAPKQALALLYGAPPADWIARARALGAGTLHMDHRRLEARHLEDAREADIGLRVYTINDPVGFGRFRRPGLSGVITDDPALFLSDAAWAGWAGR